MPEITDAEAIRFVNEKIRPMAEKLRALDALIDDLRTSWFGGGLSAHFATGADTVADGREAEGVSRLTAQDVTNLMTQAGTIATQFDGGGVMDVITKPCVRALQAT